MGVEENERGTILNQMRRMGVSCDWGRERFTMDDQLSRAVVEVFVRLYEEGLIYRGEYIVNWCPRCKTAISDLEVLYKSTEGNGKLWHVKYPVAGSSEYIVVATTRPETMLGDTAVAVHPEDPRYQSLVGKKVILPVMNREIPIIADSFVDREFGTGAVKVTPAHDPHDYEAGIRHGLAKITVIDDAGAMTEAAGLYKGMDRFDCRKELVARLEAEGYLLKIENYEYNIARCYRCSTVVEPKISMQWYLKVESLAEAGDRGCGKWAHSICTGHLQEPIFRMDVQHPRLVHFTPALVGSSHPCLVLRCMRRNHCVPNDPLDLHALRGQTA